LFKWLELKLINILFRVCTKYTKVKTAGIKTVFGIYNMTNIISFKEFYRLKRIKNDLTD